ncbi:MAG: BCCT family transporter [Pseudomonadales bacterium]|jgi:BCCT family betaine/carnitine transporter|tara:strand:+ start:1591 stop:3261 length:1671 start_codon:yes stop_codon:yes gene_type:complete
MSLAGVLPQAAGYEDLCIPIECVLLPYAKKTIIREKALRDDVHEKIEVDWFIFGVGCLILLAIIVPLVVAPQWSGDMINATFDKVTSELGVFYVIAAIATLGFLLWIAISPYGRVRLGDIENRTFSNFSWASMLFCAGIGASLIYWGAAEWVYYYVDPPFGIEPKSEEALFWAISYGAFHWGPVGWALYCLPAVTIGYSYHVRKVASLRLSAACHSVLGKQEKKWPGRIVDLMFIVGLMATCSTGLGLGTSVVSSAINRLTGLDEGTTLQFSIIGLATLLIAFSVYRDLDKGIKVLSLFNAWLAVILVAFVFIVGPTTFILETSLVAVGKISQNFFTMITWTDPLQKSTFVESWTVFYWAWWLALGPFVGMFVCKISEGRTLREIIFGMLGWGTLGCAMFFMVLGNYAVYLELNGLYPVVQQVMDIGPSAAIAGMIEMLPGGALWLVFLALIGLIFIATSYDSASYTLAAGATKALGEHDHPARWHRVFWAFGLGVLPICLISLGGVKALQTASIVASVPILFVYVLLAVSTVKMLRADSARNNWLMNSESHSAAS